MQGRGQTDNGQGYKAQSEGELLSFTALDEEEDKPWEGPNSHQIGCRSPVGRHSRSAQQDLQGARMEDRPLRRHDGPGVGWGFKFPVFFGPVQLGIVKVTVSMGIALELTPRIHR